MDYKYIEQLLQRYWECQTTLEEEAILRTFFSQKDIPAELLPYASLFQAEEQMKEEAHLGKEFDDRVLQALDLQPTVQARRISWPRRLRPLYKAAAVIAIFLTIGMAVQHGWHQPNHEVTAASDQQPGDSTAIETVDEATAETAPVADTLLAIPLNN